MLIGMILDNEFTGDLRVEKKIAALQYTGHEVSLLCRNYSSKNNYQIIKIEFKCSSKRSGCFVIRELN